MFCFCFCTIYENTKKHQKPHRSQKTKKDAILHPNSSSFFSAQALRSNDTESIQESLRELDEEVAFFVLFAVEVNGGLVVLLMISRDFFGFFF